MKQITLFALTLLLTSMSFSANAANKKIFSPDDSLYVLSVGDATMTVAAKFGARVVSLKLGDTEVLAQKTPTLGRFQNLHNYGATFWPSPQVEWNWPPIVTYDSAEYQVKLKGKSVIMTSGTDEKYPYQFIKEYTTDKKKGAFVINYTIKNVSDKAKAVAPWEISRVPGGGLMFFAAEKATVRPADIMAFQFAENNIVWLPYDVENRNRKMFADSEGWLAFVDNGILFLKTFDNIATSEAADGEDELEIYYNTGKTYIELENQGASKILQPGESLTWTVRWFVRPVKSDKPSDELVNAVKELL